MLLLLLANRNPLTKEQVREKKISGCLIFRLARAFTYTHNASEKTNEMAANRPEETNEDANSNTCDHEALLLRTTRLPECPSEEREEETAAALNKKQQPKKQILTHVLPKTLVEKTLPILRLSGLTQFIVGSGAVGLAVGLVVGGCIKDVVDSFTSAFISPLIALIGGKREIEDLYFSTGGTRFEYGAFLGVMLETFCTLFFVYYLIVVPMNALTSFKYGPLVKCDECASWIKESAKKCPQCCSYLDERRKQNLANPAKEESRPPRMRHSRSLSDELMRW